MPCLCGDALCPSCGPAQGTRPYAKRRRAAAPAPEPPRSESAILHAVRLALGSRPDVVLWRNQTGAAQHATPGGGVWHVRYGLCPGGADLIGILTVGGVGRFLALEVKSARGRLTAEQEQFLELVRARGGVAACVRSVEEAVAVVEKAIAEAEEDSHCASCDGYACPGGAGYEADEPDAAEIAEGTERGP